MKLNHRLALPDTRLIRLFQHLVLFKLLRVTTTCREEDELASDVIDANRTLEDAVSTCSVACALLLAAAGSHYYCSF